MTDKPTPENAENRRRTKEAREVANHKREQAEQERIQNELRRVAGESERQVAERLRGIAEAIRQQFEEMRKSAETARTTAEIARNAAEAARRLLAFSFCNRGRITVLVQWRTTVALLVATMIGIDAAQADEVKVMAANAVKEAYVELVSAFEKSTGHKVTTIWGGTEGVTKRISGGEIVDIVLIAAPNIDRLIAEGKLVSGSRADFAKSGVGVAVRAGLPKPDISSAEAVKRAVLAANSVAYSSGPSGFYVADLFKRMGIADEIKNKVRQPASGVQVGELVARGEADLGFQQVSELLHVKGIDYLGPLPPEIQNTTIYSTGLHTAAPALDAARTLVKWLTSPEAGSIINKIGMEPG